MKGIKIMKKLLLAAMLTVSSPNLFANSDTGTIGEFYVHATNGSVALKLVEGFPNSDALNQCPNAKWAGISNADDLLKSTLLAAKMAQATVKLSIGGCDQGWYRINAVYVQ